MQALSIEKLAEIAKTHSIEWEDIKSDKDNFIESKLSRTFNATQKQMYDLIADVGGHPKFMPHLKNLVVITPEQVGNVISENQVLIVEGLEEGGSKLGFKIFTLYPPEKVEGLLITDPFPIDEIMDRKKGKITWTFEKVTETTCKMTTVSQFDTVANTFYLRPIVDHVWMDFFENMMIELGELTPERKLTNLSIKK
jgi:ribosome-associated toxin RatA of RatAB toxin-antitoxin module